MKQNVNVGIIVGAVVVLAVILFGMYRHFFPPQGATVNPAVADQIPAYARQMRQGQAPTAAPYGGGAAKPGGTSH